jgi:peptidyl-tRNA hydrolase
MNEYDDILNRIVEEFYDTGRLVLNENYNVPWFVKEISELLRNASSNYSRSNYEEALSNYRKVLGIYDGLNDGQKNSNSMNWFDVNIPIREIKRIEGLIKPIEDEIEVDIDLDGSEKETPEEIVDIDLDDSEESTEETDEEIVDIDLDVSKNWLEDYKKNKYKKHSSGYVEGLKELKSRFEELTDDDKTKIINYFKKYGWLPQKWDFYRWLENKIIEEEEKLRKLEQVLSGYTKYISTITQQDSEKSFVEVVSNIGVEEIKDEDFPDILSNYVIDEELLKQRNDILDKIKILNPKIKNINDKREQLKDDGNENWENVGSTKLPKYENEKKNLEGQLRIIDPIKALFDSDSKWGNNYINCRTKNNSYSEYLAKYYRTLTNAHNILLNKQQIAVVNTPNSEIGERDCENYNLEKLTTEIGRVSNREDIKNELTNNFTEYKENDVISNLVNKSINLVDNIFKMIIDKEILSNTPLQKYKSYMNMIKIYSQGENQKEKLTQLVYDLNQLKSIVESYDTLTGTADSPQSSDEEDGQEEGTKLLSKTKLQSLLNDISKNSWDKEKVKDYFVKVREHNNVAYEKSFEKKCNEIQYFEKVTGGDSPRIIDETNNNTHLVNYILSAVTENNYITTEKIVETIFSEVKDLLNNEDAIERRLKKYDLKVLYGVTLTQKNGSETFELLPSEEKYIEVKDTKPKDYHFSEFFGVYKSTKSEVYKRMKNLLDDEETDENKNFERYNEFVEGLVEKFKSEEGKQIIDIIKSKLRGVFFEKYEFCPIDNIKFTWSTVGQGKEGNREKRVTIRIEPIDYDKIYVWKEGNSNCGRFKFDGCEENPGCTQNESTDRLDEIIENFFDTGKFVF